ncbi:hypothetical protein PBI_GAIA_160 [Mycobacterium phage Gaia]|uniref:Uncharacterized protein n=1 Tax=Mycobacterium phage Gaia TaxID=1486472 RepID=A0A068F4S5_9CAUD|nr:hypothetical protein VC46_gp076 [Mycobacterium phage Gaia]AID58976.1 hypothetical protein PBI_GAIA_160 [Mycobacterium phage Gaia]AYR00087.1 hypothetical protein PBI_NEBKISS_156 [Mycobacterium phage Nebkiss]
MIRYLAEYHANRDGFYWALMPNSMRTRYIETARTIWYQTRCERTLQ